MFHGLMVHNHRWKNISSEEILELLKLLDIVINKHNAARTGREQPCDLASLFRSLKRLMKKLLEGGSHKFGYDDTIKRVKDILKKCEKEYGLNLGAKYNILVSFLVCLPDGVSQAVKDRDTLVKGFVKSGMNDEACSGLPSFVGVISTVRFVSGKMITKEHCPQVLLPQREHGLVMLPTHR